VTLTLADTTNSLSGLTTAAGGLLGNATAGLLDPIVSVGSGTNTLLAATDRILTAATGTLLGSGLSGILTDRIDLLANTGTTFDITSGVGGLLATADSLGGNALLGTGDLLANAATLAANVTTGLTLAGEAPALVQTAQASLGTIDLFSSPLGVVEGVISSNRSVSGTTAALVANTQSRA
jgi:hypothetical protein